MAPFLPLGLEVAPSRFLLIFRSIATTVHIPLKEYLTTCYRPDCEYVNGEVRERSVGKWEHARVR